MATEHRWSTATGGRCSIAGRPIDRADGTTAAFVTQRVEQHAKDDFPTQAVYGRTPDPQLRLITCGGEFDDKDRRYLDNVIVYATRLG